MRVFCDTSVLVAASVETHEHHVRAFAVVERVAHGLDDGFIAAHSLAETYAVLTRLPISPRIHSTEAARIIAANIEAFFKTQVLNARDYSKVVHDAAAAGLTGGAIYDALLLACAAKAAVERIYTFDLADFRRIAPALAKIMASP